MVEIEFFYDGYGKVYPYVVLPFWEAWRLFGLRGLVVRTWFQFPMVRCELIRGKPAVCPSEEGWIELREVADEIRKQLW